MIAVLIAVLIIGSLVAFDLVRGLRTGRISSLLNITFLRTVVREEKPGVFRFEIFLHAFVLAGIIAGIVYFLP